MKRGIFTQDLQKNIKNDINFTKNTRVLMYSFVFFLINTFTTVLFASNPTAMSNNSEINGSWSNKAMTLVGVGTNNAVFTLREQASSGGTKHYEFNSDSYYNTWDFASPSFNSVVTTTWHANWGYQAGNITNSVTSGRYYTCNIRQGSSYANQDMAILELASNPKDISSYSTGLSVYNGQTASVTVTMSGSLGSGEYLYVAYSTDGFVTSGNSGAVAITSLNGSYQGTATIPSKSTGTIVTYYPFTSTSSTAPSFSNIPLLTLNMRNGTAQNTTDSYSSYTVIAQPTVTTTATPASITSSDAVGGGSGISGTGITTEGLVWSKSSTTTTPILSTNDGFTNNGGTGASFSSNSITGLSAQTHYYITAYATNPGGTGYGPYINYYTLSTAPTVQASGLSIPSSATTSLNLSLSTAATYPGSGATKSGYLLLYNTGSYPTMQGSPNGLAPASAKASGTIVSITDGNAPTAPTFPGSITGLSSSTTYYLLLVPYTWDGTNAATYNYLTASAAQATASTTAATSSATDYFRSKQTGNWNTAADWESSPDNSAWITSTLVPGSSAAAITIQTGHTITLDLSPTIGSGKTLTVNGTLTAGTHTISGTGGIFTISSGTLNTANSSGITGTIQTTGTKSFTSGTINFNAGGTQSFGGTGLTLTGMDVTTTGTVTLDAAISVKSLTINSGTFDVSSSNYGVTIATGGTFSNSGTFTAQSGTLTFSGGATITGSNTTSLYNVSFANGSTVNIAKTVSSSQIFSMTSGATYSFNFTNNATLTTGGISSTGVNTLNLLNGGSSASSKFISSSDLSISNGTSLSLGTSALPLQVNGNVSLAGTGSLTLSSIAGGDIFLTGNWSRNSGTFTPNQRAVTFNGTGAQTMQNTNSGSLTFDYLAIKNTGGSVQLLSDVAVSYNLQLFNGTLDLNQKTLTISNTSNLELGDGSGSTTESVTSSTSTGIIAIPTGKTVTATKFNGAGTPSFSFGNNVKLSATGTFNPGSGLTTFASGSTLQLNSGGSISTNSPTYATGSSLIYYDTSTDINSSPKTVGLEWPGSGPSNVSLLGATGTCFQLDADRSINGYFTIGTGAKIRGNNNTLTMSGGSASFTNNGTMFGEYGGATFNLTFSGTTTLSGSTGYLDAKNYIVSGTLNCANIGLNTNSTSPAKGSVTINNGGKIQTTNTYGLWDGSSSNTTIRYSSGNMNAPTLSTGSTVDYDKTDGGQAVSGLTYSNLTISNTSGSQTAGGNLVVNGTLTTTSGGTLDLGSSYTLSGTLGTITNNGTIKTSNTGATPIATSKTWTGTIDYAAASGSQTIVAGTYNNLKLSNTSGSQSMGSSVVVNGTLTMPTGTGTVAVGSNAITLSGPYVSGTVNNLTSTSSSNLTFNFSGTGPFTLPALSAVNNLTINTSGQTYNLNSSPVVSGTFTVSTGSTLNAGSDVISGSGAFTLSSGATLKVAHTSGIDGVITVAGTKTFDAAANYEFNGSSGQVTGSLLPATVNNLTINNAAGVSQSGDNTVSGTLALNNGAYSIGAHTLNIDGPISTTSGTLTGGSTSNITIAGAGTSTTLPSISGGLGTLTLSRGNGTTIGSDISIATALNVTAGTVTATAAKLTLPAGSKATISSGATLNMGNIELNKTVSSTSQFDNRGTVTIGASNKIRLKVHFVDDTQWQFVSFPFAISTVYKSDGTTTASINTDYGLMWYDTQKRANRDLPAWTAVSALPLTAGKGYAVWGTTGDMYFETAANPDLSSFTSTTTKSLDYLTKNNGSGGLDVNYGWNFFAHPVTSNAYGKLNDGEFLYYYDYAGKCYGSGGVPATSLSNSSNYAFESYFIKTTAARTMNYSTIDMPLSVRSFKTSTADLLTLNLVCPTYTYSTLMRVMPDATSGYDNLYDAPFSQGMLSQTPEIYTFIDGAKFAINSVPEQTTIPLGVRVPDTGTYTLNWNLQTSNLPISLYDNVMQKSIDLNSVSSYEFSSTVPGEVNNRFYITVPQRVITDVISGSNDKNLQVYAQNNQIKINGINEPSSIKIYDVAGKSIYQQSIGSSAVEILAPCTGVYVLEISNPNLKYKTKLICK